MTATTDVDLSTPKKADMPLVERIAHALKCGYNQLIGGYIRAPVISTDNGVVYYVSGECAIVGAECHYQAPQRTLRDVCYSCGIYQNMVKKK